VGDLPLQKYIMNAIREGFHTLKIKKNCLDFLCHYRGWL
jgi:hypothetical protein